MLDWLKKIFANKEEKTGEAEETEDSKEMSIEDLDAWFSEYTHKSRESVKQKILPSLKTIATELGNLAEYAKQLKEAKLLNENIPQKERQIMEGSRDFYIRRIELLIPQLKPEQDEKITTEYATAYIGLYHRLMNEFTQSTAKPYVILSQFFRDKTASIGKCVKEMDENISDITKVVGENKDLALINEIRALILRLKKSLDFKMTMDKDVSEHDGQIAELEKEIADVEAKINNLKVSPGHEEFAALHNKMQDYEKQINRLKDDLSQKFAAIAHPLRKFERHASDASVVQEYLENAPDALEADTELKIIPQLRQFSELVSNSKIELKDKKADKSLEVIQSLTVEFFGSYIEKLKALKAEKMEVEKLLMRNTVMGEVSELQYRLEHLTSKKEKHEKNITEWKAKEEKLQINELKASIKEKVKSLADITVDII